MEKITLGSSNPSEIESRIYSSEKKTLFKNYRSLKPLLKQHYGGNLVSALSELFPGHQWLPWKFKNGVHLGFWQSPENRKKFLEWVGAELRIEKMEDWYIADRDKILKLGGKGLLSVHYKGSLIMALKENYPEYDWLPWKFKNGVSTRYWQSPENRKKYMDWLGEQLKIEKMEDWYQVGHKEISRGPTSGRSLFSEYYQGSVMAALKENYPEYEWLPWKFKHGPFKGFWAEPANQRKFLRWAASELNVADPADLRQWNAADAKKRIIGLGGRALLRKHENSLEKVLAILKNDEGISNGAQGPKKMQIESSQGIIK